MSTTLDFKYRIIYESLSRFSSTLSRSVTLEEVKHCLQRQIKYLFDYQLLRFCFYQQDYYIVYTLTPTGCTLHYSDGQLLWPHERLLLSRDMPTILDDADLIADSLRQAPLPLAHQPTQIWGWNVGFNPGSGLMVSVFSGGRPAVSARRRAYSEDRARKPVRQTALHPAHRRTGREPKKPLSRPCWVFRKKAM